MLRDLIADQLVYSTIKIQYRLDCFGKASQ